MKKCKSKDIWYIIQWTNVEGRIYNILSNEQKLKEGYKIYYPMKKCKRKNIIYYPIKKCKRKDI